MSELSNQVKDFWNENHRAENVDVLSGVSYDTTVTFLKINPVLKDGATVLEVGVGLGYVTEGLFSRGMRVTAIDISEVGLERVKKFCESTYTINNISNIPSDYFDIIICNNVIQHIPTDLLIVELREIIRSLKKGGMFAFNFVSSDISEDTGINPTLCDVRAGRLCRNPDYLKRIISELGAKCEIVFSTEINISILRGHHVAHVTKL